jgi:hypothetical protein
VGKVRGSARARRRTRSPRFRLGGMADIYWLEVRLELAERLRSQLVPARVL